MSRNECAVCARHPHPSGEDHVEECRSTIADLGMICTGCALRIRGDLDDLLDSWTLTAVYQWRTPATSQRRSGGTFGLPGGTEWIDWRSGHELFGTLTSWVRDWIEPGTLTPDGFAGPKRSDLASLTGWLRAHLPTAASVHPAISDFADEVGSLARYGRRIAELDDRGSSQRVECPSDGCGSVLRIDVADLEAPVPCRSCGSSRSVAQLLYLAGHSDVWVDEEVASLATGVPGSTLRRWAKAGKVERKDARYRLPSVRAYLQERSA